MIETNNKGIFNLKTDVFFEKRNQYSYPNAKNSFSPSINYPEYPFDDIAIEPNEIYDMVRSLFCGMGLDAEHYGAADWNPLGELINPGNNVVLKPNMVMHKHVEDEALGIDSIITHPSIVRAVADYCFIALKGTGTVSIGDAPLQTCDFDALANASGYTKIVDFYSHNKINIELEDFRLVHTRMIRKFFANTIQSSIARSDYNNYISVDIGKHSALMEKIGLYKRFRVTKYDPHNMQTHHNPDKNEYLIPKAVLRADVIINLPKPKTHRKAGITAAMKNLVGINGHKDWLPHHTMGSSITDGGDEYLNGSALKHISTLLREKEDIAAKTDYFFLNCVWKTVRFFFSHLSLRFNKDPFFEGSWYGNDTIWRTVCDLNRVLIYSDEHGNLHPGQQRKYMQIGDMILSGEGEGPLAPTPKKVGLLVGAVNPLVFDTAVCAAMGMDWETIPTIRGAYGIEAYPIAQIDRKDIRIHSNASEWNNVSPTDISRSKSFQFAATKGWQGHIELER